MARTSKLLANSVAALLLVAATCACADETAPSPQDEKDLKTLAAIWHANSTDVKSAHIQYRSLARAPAKESTREAVLKLLNTLDFINRPDDARLLSHELGLNISPEQPAWGNGELYVTDRKIRVNSDYAGRRHTEIVFVDDIQIVANRPNDQINIHARKSARQRGKSLADLRFIPRLAEPTNARIEKRLADGLVVSIVAKELVVDGATGFVRSASTQSLKTSEDVLQIGPVPYPEGIVFPTGVITCRYVGEHLQFISVDVIEGATINQPIKDDVFAIAAPAGSKVFDSRLNRGDRGYYTPVDESVTDVVSQLGLK